MTVLTCKIPDDLDSRLEELARRAKMPKSKVVRKVLEAAVQARSKNGTAFDLVKDLCGSLSGPSDLATNPKYLEGLGG